MACGGKSLKHLPHCCCNEGWPCADFPYCLHRKGSTKSYTANASVDWPANAIGCEARLWGRGGDGGASGGANQGGGGGGSGGFLRVFFPKAGDSVELFINDAGNGYHTEIFTYDGLAYDLMGRVYAARNGGAGPNGAGGYSSTIPPYAVGEIGANAFDIGACAHAGSSGANGSDGNYGGGGGGGPGSKEPGNNAYQQNGGAGGVDRGGKGGDGTASNGQNGADYGGAGAGGYNNGTGGTGGKGRIEITFLYKVTLDITVTGAPGNFSVTCDDCVTTTVDQTGLNSTFRLEQDAPFSSSFSLALSTDVDGLLSCDAADVRGEGILIETIEDSCGGVGWKIETERYVHLITATLGCADGRMHIASFGIGLCQCSRQEQGTEGDWTAWSCADYGGGYPPYPGYEFNCTGSGTVQNTAPPCKLGHTMKTELLWPVPYEYPTPCGMGFDCTTPTVGHITGAVSGAQPGSALLTEGDADVLTEGIELILTEVM